MSSYILSNESLTTLAKAISTIENGGFNYCGFSGSDRTARALNPFYIEHGHNETAVFYALATLNAQAYAGRYNEPVTLDAFIFDEKAPDYMRPIQYENGAPVFTADHYKLLKSLDCFLYQIDEDATNKSELKTALEETRDNLANAILRARPEYIAAPWK